MLRRYSYYANTAKVLDKQIKPVICEYPEALRVDCRDFFFVVMYCVFVHRIKNKKVCNKFLFVHT